jgi:hypothetical protein
MRDPSSFVLTVVARSLPLASCHAGGRGFESRRSRFALQGFRAAVAEFDRRSPENGSAVAADRSSRCVDRSMRST